ncbi:MAG: hypothetical protein PHW76_02030 [Alphaproteobacteria bacterium]|nr:hypothetical protein [Alphaproteobacteria bacterium]
MRIGILLDQYLNEHVREKVVDKNRAETALVSNRTFFGKTPIKKFDHSRLPEIR